MKVTLERIENIAPHTQTFWFAAERSVNYIAGQFVELVLPHDNPDDRGIKRWFTLSSSPSEKLLAITTKFSTKSSSFKAALQALTPGSTLNLSDPMGDFVLPKNKANPLVFCAGGIGVTPFRSMAKQLIDDSEADSRNISTYYGVRTLGDACFKPELSEVGTLNIVLSEPSAQWKGLTGYISAEMLVKDQPKTAMYYIAGPEQMVEKLYKELQAIGISKQKIVGDYFPGY